jgi:UDP:flavonoid glycosyltransferase YjiC (YdhE family)
VSDQPPSNGTEVVEILEISDCRFPGQISRTLAAEIDAQADAGWRTAVRHVNGPLVARSLPFHAELAGHLQVGRARLLLGRNPIEARVTLIRHPALLEHAVLDQLPPILTDAVVLVAGAGPARDDGTDVYDPAAVEAVAQSTFGRRPLWAPTTSVIRDELLSRLPGAEITEDWFHPDRYQPLDPERHRHRLEPFVGPPPSTSPASDRDQARRPRALFLTSNGAGMGHLTRLLAYARRLQDKLEPHFLSLSQAVGVVRSYGMAYEYLPSTGASGLSPREWNAIFVARVRETIERIRPEIIIFDATYPYAGVQRIRELEPAPIWVWSRRGMWKAEHDGERARAQVGKAMWFDAVLEPGDFAAAYDRGITAQQTCERVRPVTLLDDRELADRTEARRALGLPADGPLALLSLGAGNINDTSGDVGAATQALRKLGVGICVTQNQIGVAGRVPDDVFGVSHFPLSEYLKAFDLSVSAAGYNSYHELLRFGVPTLFVPNTKTSLDDQAARARFAADNGLACAVDEIRVDETADLLADLLANGHEMVARLRDPGNGAADGARLIARIAGREDVVA